MAAFGEEQREELRLKFKPLDDIEGGFGTALMESFPDFLPKPEMLGKTRVLSSRSARIECRSLIGQCPGERLSLSWFSSWRCTLCSTWTDHRLATASRCKRIAVATYSPSAGLPAHTP